MNCFVNCTTLSGCSLLLMQRKSSTGILLRITQTPQNWRVGVSTESCFICKLTIKSQRPWLCPVPLPLSGLEEPGPEVNCSPQPHPSRGVSKAEVRAGVSAWCPGQLDHGNLNYEEVTVRKRKSPRQPIPQMEKKKKIPLTMGCNQQILINITGSGPCLHRGQVLPRRSLCRPLSHFLWQKAPAEGWPSKTPEGGTTLVLLQLDGKPGPPVRLQGQGLRCPMSHSTHKTQPSNGGPTMQPPQCQAQEQLRRAEHSGQGSAGSPGQRRASQESSPPPHLPGSLLFREQAGLGPWPEKTSSWLEIPRALPHGLPAEEGSEAPSWRVCRTRANGQPPETPPLGPSHGEGQPHISLCGPLHPLGTRALVKKQMAGPTQTLNQSPWG